jgi:hypothetical protein
MADLQNGLIVLKVGDSEFLVDEETVRHGGTMQAASYSVTLTPQERNFWQRLTGEQGR